MASLSIRVEPFYAYVLEVIDQIDELSATPDGEAIPLTELKFVSFLAKASVTMARKQKETLPYPGEGFLASCIQPSSSSSVAQSILDDPDTLDGMSSEARAKMPLA